ncbi:MAG: hypothetical protein WCF71_10060 [Verrucomicrobiia bacterium]
MSHVLPLSPGSISGKTLPRTAPLLSRFFMFLTKPNRFRLHFDPDSPSPVEEIFTPFADDGKHLFHLKVVHIFTEFERHLSVKRPGFLDVCLRLAKMAAGRGRQPASPSAVTRRWKCPDRLHFARRSGVDCRGDKSDGEELQLHPEHPRHRTVEILPHPHAVNPDWKPGDTAAKDGCRYIGSARSRLLSGRAKELARQSPSPGGYLKQQ